MNKQQPPESQDGTSNAQEKPSECPDNEDALKKLADEALVVYGGTKTNVNDEDLSTVSSLREWVRDKLKVDDLAINRDFIKLIADAGESIGDLVVCVLEVAPEKEVDLVVSDASSMAVVIGLSDMVITNLVKSHNGIQKGEWIKLRSVIRIREQYKRANGSNYATIKASNYSCVTRLPQLSLPYVKPIKPTSPRSKRNRKANRMKMWNEASRLNKAFPRKLHKSTGYLDRLLQFNCVEEGGFTKATPTVDSETEEGEIT